MKLKAVTRFYFALLFSVFSNFGNYYFSQSLHFEISPNYNFVFGTFQVDRLTIENDISLHSKVNDKVDFAHGAFGLDLTIVKTRKISVGLSYFKGSALTRLKFSYSYFSNITDSSNYITEITESQGNTTNIHQFGTFLKYSFKDYSQNKTRLNHSIAIYLYALFDKTNFMPLYDNYLEFGDGNLVSNYENYPMKFQNKRGFAAMTRYEMAINTKNNKNLLTIFLGYQQGFNLMDEISLNVNHSNGLFLTANSRSKGSYFTIGIAKPILIWPR